MKELNGGQTENALLAKQVSHFLSQNQFTTFKIHHTNYYIPDMTDILQLRDSDANATQNIPSG